MVVITKAAVQQEQARTSRLLSTALLLLSGPSGRVLVQEQHKALIKSNTLHQNKNNKSEITHRLNPAHTLKTKDSITHTSSTLIHPLITCD